MVVSLDRLRGIDEELVDLGKTEDEIVDLLARFSAQETADLDEVDFELATLQRERGAAGDTIGGALSNVAAGATGRDAVEVEPLSRFEAGAEPEPDAEPVMPSLDAAPLELAAGSERLSLDELFDDEELFEPEPVVPPQPESMASDIAALLDDPEMSGPAAAPAPDLGSMESELDALLDGREDPFEEPPRTDLSLTDSLEEALESLSFDAPEQEAAEDAYDDDYAATEVVSVDAIAGLAAARAAGLSEADAVLDELLGSVAPPAPVEEPPPSRRRRPSEADRAVGELLSSIPPPMHAAEQGASAAMAADVEVADLEEFDLVEGDFELIDESAAAEAPIDGEADAGPAEPGEDVDDPDADAPKKKGFFKKLFGD